MLTRLNSNRDLVSAYQVIGHSDVIEIIHFDHHMIESLVRTSDSKRDGMIARIAMHKDQLNYSLAHSDLVFHSAAHSQLSIETLCRGEVLFAYDAMPQSTRAGLETP